MVSADGGTRHGPDPTATDGEGEGAESPQHGADQIGPADIRAVMAEIGTSTGRIKARYAESSPTAFTDTIYDLIDAVETLARAVARQYGLDALYGSRCDETPEDDA